MGCYTILGPAVVDGGATTRPTLWRGAAKISGGESKTNNYAEYSGVINGITTAAHILDCLRRVHPKLTPVVFVEGDSMQFSSQPTPQALQSATPASLCPVLQGARGAG